MNIKIKEEKGTGKTTISILSNGKLSIEYNTGWCENKQIAKDVAVNELRLATKSLKDAIKNINGGKNGN